MPGNLELQEFEHDTPRVLAESRRGSDRLFFSRIATALPLLTIGMTSSFSTVALARFSHAVGSVRGQKCAGDHSSANAGRGFNVSIPAHDGQFAGRC